MPRGRPIAPLWRCPLPHPGAGPARRASAGPSGGQGAEAAQAPARGCGAAPFTNPELGLAAQPGPPRAGVGRGVAGVSWDPGRQAVRLPPSAPAAGCDRPGEPAAAFCRAGPARSAAARPGRSGPPRPAGALAAVIPRPPPGSLGAPPTTPRHGGLWSPARCLAWFSREPAVGAGRHAMARVSGPGMVDGWVGEWVRGSALLAREGRGMQMRRVVIVSYLQTASAFKVSLPFITWLDSDRLLIHSLFHKYRSSVSYESGIISSTEDNDY